MFFFFFLNNGTESIIINRPADSRSNPTRNTREILLLLAKSASLLYPTLTMKALRVNFFFPNEGSLIIAVTISDTKLQAIYFLHYKPRSNPNEVAFDFDISSCKKKKGGGGSKERGEKKKK